MLAYRVHLELGTPRPMARRTKSNRRPGQGYLELSSLMDAGEGLRILTRI